MHYNKFINFDVNNICKSNRFLYYNDTLLVNEYKDRKF